MSEEIKYTYGLDVTVRCSPYDAIYDTMVRCLSTEHRHPGAGERLLAKAGDCTTTHEEPWLVRFLPEGLTMDPILRTERVEGGMCIEF